MDNEKCEICDHAIHDGFDGCPNCGKNLTSFRLRYTEQEVSDMLRTLAKYIDDNMNDCYLPDTEICKEVYPVNVHKQCVKCMIDYAKNNPTEEAGE